jgi:hypothetical protein
MTACTPAALLLARQASGPWQWGPWLHTLLLLVLLLAQHLWRLYVPPQLLVLLLVLPASLLVCWRLPAATVVLSSVWTW